MKCIDLGFVMKSGEDLVEVGRFHGAGKTGNSGILQEDQNSKFLYKAEELENARPLQETANNNKPRWGPQAVLRDLSKF